MSTRDLFEKHRVTLKKIEMEAADNVNEARQRLGEMREERQEAQRLVKELEETMKKNQSGFLGAAKAIFKMAYKSPENPEEIGEVIEPILGFQAALVAMPMAKEGVREAIQLEDEAGTELNAATYFHSALEGLVEVADDE